MPPSLASLQLRPGRAAIAAGLELETLGRADPIAEPSNRTAPRHPAHRSDQRSRRYARAVRPSPARARPHDAGAWLPLTDLDVLPPVAELLGAVERAAAGSPPAGGRGADVRPGPSRPEGPVVRPSPARAEPHDPDAWFPLRALEEMLAPDRLVDSGQTRAIAVAEPAPAVDPSPARPEPAPRPARSARRPRGAAARRVDRATRRRRAMILALAAATLAAGGATVPSLVAGAGTPEVTLRVDGERLVVSTEADTVQGLLREEGVVVGADDRVAPPLRTEITDGLTVAVFRAFDMNVDFDGAVSNVRTTRRSVSRLQHELGLDPGRVVVKSAPDRLGAGALVVFRTLREVTVDVDGASLTETTTGLTVAEVLDDYSVVLGDLDHVEPPLDARVTDGIVVTVVRISDDLTETVTEEIPFPEERRDDPSLPQGETVVVQEGVTGVQDVTYRIVTADGAEMGREAISKVPVIPPVPRIVMVGTALPNSRVGTASWYESPFGDDSCATKEYVPRGTIVRVTNLDTGASTTCRVADRVEADRVVDLDDDVFAQLAPLSQGIFNARIDW